MPSPARPALAAIVVGFVSVNATETQPPRLFDKAAVSPVDRAVVSPVDKAAESPAVTHPGVSTVVPSSARIPPAIAAAKLPVVALLATPAEGDETSLIFQEVNAATAAPVAQFKHLPEAAVTGALVPGTTSVAAIADVVPARDRSWASSLFLVQPGQQARVVADRIYRGSRPLVEGNRIFVERGQPGVSPTEKDIEDGRLREDDITIDEVNVSSGAARTIHTFHGYTAYLSGFNGTEVILYRVRYEQADIVGVNPDTGAVRTIAPTVLPFARDFSVDQASRTLLFTNRSPTTTTQWEVRRVDLNTGNQNVLTTASTPHLAPHAWIDRQVVFNPGGSAGLTSLNPGDSSGTKSGGAAPARIAAPMGAGVDKVKQVFMHKNENWAAALHYTDANHAVPFVLNIQSGQSFQIPAPPDARVEIAGIVNATP